MAYLEALLGTLEGNYSDTQYTSGNLPRLGDWCYVKNYTPSGYSVPISGKFIFLKNSGSSAITAKLTAMSLTTGKSLFTCTLTATTDALLPFAGVRIPGASSLAQNEYGWFQVSGPAVFLHSGGQATAAEDGVISSASVAGKVEGEPPNAGSYTAAGVRGIFAVAEAAVTTLDVDVRANIIKNVWGL